MKFFLKRLQEDQEDMLELIKQREKARKTGLEEPKLPGLKIPAPAVEWDLPYTPPHRIQPAAVDAFVQVCGQLANSHTVRSNSYFGYMVHEALDSSLCPASIALQETE